MCNVGPQSRRLNEQDWRLLEEYVLCLGKLEEFIIHAGPLFPEEPYKHCGCTRETAGTLSCEECDGENEIAFPIPFAYWKILIRVSDNSAWTWIYTKTQTPCVEDASAEM